ncbi:helix-turn-helix domain-containing protein [Nocardia camponoti]|uniref:Transcriptional regulator n=1 Tax=Nocardia camponoti TaxID=1616106 RepID=A0A917Q7Q6_9NOCA|nr:helix-turn-helix domain-containing protein [Nocardia camponoti]GGK34083.1 transcriptional regulator [Nocardia camponoti]
MTGARNWREVKAEGHRLNPDLANPELRAEAAAQLDGRIAGHHLKELRQGVGVTQAELAAALGVSQARVSQIENGDLAAMELETLRAYARALGGHVDISVSVGPHTIKVA